MLASYSAHALVEERLFGPRIRRTLARPVLNLFHAEPNGKLFRRQMDHLLKVDPYVPVGSAILRAAEVLSDEVLDAVATQQLNHPA